MMEELIAKRYAKALSSVSTNIEEAANILSILTEAIDTDEVKSVLSSPVVAAEKKTGLILDALGENMDETVINFIKILGENRRLDILPEIVKVLNADIQRESNQYEGVLRSSKTLDDEELNRLEKTLEKYTGSTIKLTQKQTDFDGVRVSVDDLGIEVNFSKQRVKEQLIDFIKKSL